MKKNKKVQFALFGLVLIIWGGVFYEVFGYKNKQFIAEKTTNEFLAIKDSGLVNEDLFEIKLGYNDPFGENKEFQISNNTTKKNNNVFKQGQTNQSITNLTMISSPQQSPKKQLFPEIKYIGFATKGGANPIIKVSINGIYYNLKVQDRVETVLLSEANKDSIAFIWEGERKVIKRRKNSQDGVFQVKNIF